MRQLYKHLKLRFWWCLTLNIEAKSIGAVANRYIRVIQIDTVEITVTARDTTKTDGYSTEELMQLEKLVLAERVRRGWEKQGGQCSVEMCYRLIGPDGPQCCITCPHSHTMRCADRQRYADKGFIA